MAVDSPNGAAERHCVYSAVFDTDSDTANNWQYADPFDWDLFRDTDRWYRVAWDPASSSWNVAVSNTVDLDDSNARVVIDGDTIVWFVPMDELGPSPAVRVTSFRHDGTYGAEVSGASVSGADPTEPPLPVPSLP